MTPQERQLIDTLFDRLAGLENAPRDPEAERAIIEGLRKAPNAAYALVQTTLLQDEALKRANARIEELQAALDGPHASQSQQSGSFLDSMRDAVFGAGGSRGSVPNVRPADPGTSRPVWNSGQVNSQAYGGDDPHYGDPRYGGYAPGPGQGPGYGYGYGAPQGGGSSFLGTAAAAAVGVVGGSMLMNGIRGLMGGHQAFASAPAFGNSNTGGPWAGNDLSNSDLARDAGLNDIGSSRQAQSQSLLDDTSHDDDARNDYASNDDHDDDDGFDDDVGGGGGDDSDFA